MNLHHCIFFYSGAGINLWVLDLPFPRIPPFHHFLTSSLSVGPATLSETQTVRKLVTAYSSWPHVRKDQLVKMLVFLSAHPDWPTREEDLKYSWPLEMQNIFTIRKRSVHYFWPRGFWWKTWRRPFVLLVETAVEGWCWWISILWSTNSSVKMKSCVKKQKDLSRRIQVFISSINEAK